MVKTVDIKNGKAAHELKWNGSLSSLHFNEPLSLHWPDCIGSLGKFFVILPHNEEYRKQIHRKINEAPLSICQFHYYKILYSPVY